MTRLAACAECETRSYYAGSRCPACGGRTERVDEDLGRGELVAVTTVHVTPPGVPSPNRLGVARFDGDVQVLAQLADDLDAGDTVALRGDEALDESGETRGPRLHAD